MKKKVLSALIAGGIATVGVGASLSTAIALYYQKPDPVNVDISLTTTTDANLALTVQNPQESYVFNPNGIDITYNIKGLKEADSTYTQPYVVGKLGVTITSTSETLLNLMDFTNVVDYMNNGAATFFSNNYSSMTFDSAATASGDKYVRRGTMIAPTVMLENGSQEAGLGVALGIDLAADKTIADLVSLTNTGFTIDISYVNPTDEEYYTHFESEPAYVRGIDGVWSASSEEFMMVPNIYSTYEYGVEWMWIASKAYPSSSFKAMRVGLNKNVTPAVKEEIWAAGDNVTSELAVGDAIYWTGYSSAETGNPNITRLVKATV